MSYSKYPQQIDSESELPISEDNVTLIDAELINRLRDAVIAVESTLGVNPQGVYGTVRDRLDSISSNGGGGGSVVLAGDVNGPSNSNTVSKIRNIPIAEITPIEGDVIYHDGSEFNVGKARTTSDNVSYDNTSSGLISENVKDALDELASREVSSSDFCFIFCPGGVTNGIVYTEWEDIINAIPEEGHVLVLIDGNASIPVGEWDLDSRVTLAGYKHSKPDDIFSSWYTIELDSDVIIKNPCHIENLVIQSNGGKFTFDDGNYRLKLKDVQVYNFSDNGVFEIPEDSNVIVSASGDTYDTALNAKSFNVFGNLDLCLHGYLSFFNNVAVGDGSIYYYILSSSVDVPSQWNSTGYPSNVELYNYSRNIYLNPKHTNLTENVQDAIIELADRKAVDIEYNNITSGLISTDVQGALDELAQSGGGGSGISSVNTLDDLRAIDSSSLNNFSIYLVRETGNLWRYESTTGANEIDDSNLSVKPNDILQTNNGRWRPVISHGKPGIVAGPVTIPTSYLPAGLNIIGAKPIVDGSPEGPGLFAGIAVDRGDTAGVKDPYPILGLNENGNWIFADLDMSTLQAKEFYQFRDNEFRIETYPNDGAKKIAVHPKFGTSGFTSDDLDLSIEAGGTDQDNIAQVGNLILKGGDHGDPGGTGGDVLIKPGKSGGSAARLGMSALCDEDGVPVVAVTKDKLAFFGGTLTEKPTIIGDWSDGTAGEFLAEKLQDLGLITDSTVNTGGGGSNTNILASETIELPTASSPEDVLVYTVPACIDGTISMVLLSVEEQLVGAGDITVRTGTTAGDDDLIIDQVIDSTTPIGHVAGKDISTLGAAWPASTGYVLDVKENDEIHVRVTTTGTVDSGKLKVYVLGAVLS